MNLIIDATFAQIQGTMEIVFGFYVRTAIFEYVSELEMDLWRRYLR